MCIFSSYEMMDFVRLIDYSCYMGYGHLKYRGSHQAYFPKWAFLL